MVVEVEIGDAKPISYSAYDTRTQCAKKFHLARELKVPEKPAMYFAAGSAIHLTTAVIDLLASGDRGADWDWVLSEAERMARDVGLEQAQEALVNGG